MPVVAVFLCDLRIRVNGVAVAAERIDLHAVFFYGIGKFLQLFIVRKQNGRVAMRLAGVAARADLKLLDTECFEVCKRFVEGTVAEKNGYNA